MTKYITLPSKMNDLSLDELDAIGDNSMELMAKYIHSLNLSASDAFKNAIAYQCMLEATNVYYGAEKHPYVKYSRYNNSWIGEIKGVFRIQSIDCRVSRAAMYNFMATLPSHEERT